MNGTSAMATPEQRTVPEPSAAPLPASQPGTSPQPTPGLPALQTGAGNAALAAAATNGAPPPYGDALALQSTYGNAAVVQSFSQPKAADQAAPGVATTPVLIIEDTVESPKPGQMKKSDFLAELQTAVCKTAAEALAGTPWSEKGCPYIEHWFGYYQNQGAQHVERAVRKYAPGTGGATTARDYIPIICERVRGPIEVWAKTGQITGVPEGPATPLPNAPTAGSAPTSDTAAGMTTAPPNASPVLPKALNGGAREARDPQAIQAQLGAGRPLEAGVQSRMGAAFGHDFSHVRLHTDATAGRLSSDLNARAFTVGEHIAFASSEYRPGTPVGDALIAHELAHVVQQGTAGHSNVPMLKGEGDYNALEEDADISAVGVIASLWTGVKGKLSEVGKNAAPRLRSGLKLQRCTIEQAPTNLKTAEAKAKWIAQAMKDDNVGASQEIVKMFKSSATQNEFLDIQKRLDMAEVIDYLRAWDAIQVGAIGPVIAGAEKLNEIRADYIVDAVNDYSLPNAMVFTLFMFNTMYTDDMHSVLKKLATNKRMGSTILHMDPVLAIIKKRGLNIDDYKDPGESAYYFGRGVVSGLKNFLRSGEAAKSSVSMRYYGEKFTLPPEYQEALGKIEKAEFDEAMSPGNMVFGTIDYISFGIPGSVYGLARGTVGGVIDLTKGNYEAAGGELTGAMLLILTYLGAKAVAKIRAPAGPGGALMGPEGPGQFALEQPKGVPKAVSRLNTIVQLGADGEAAATALINRLGEDGVLEVGRYIQADSKAARFVYENGVAGAEALQKAKGNLAEAGKLLPKIPKLQLPPATAVPEPPPAPKTVPPAVPPPVEPPPAEKPAAAPPVSEKTSQQIAAEKAAAEKAAAEKAAAEQKAADEKAAAAQQEKKPPTPEKTPQQIAAEKLDALRAQRAAKQAELKDLQQRTRDLEKDITQAENDRLAAWDEYNKATTPEARGQALAKMRDAKARKDASKAALDETPSNDSLEGEIKNLDSQIEAESPKPTRPMTPLLKRYLTESGGRWGGTSTRVLNDKLATDLESKGYTVTGGAGRAAEEWIPGPGGGTEGGRFVDITAKKGAETVRIQTVTTLADGVTPTPEEAAAAARIRARYPNDKLILIPKVSK